jgi:3,4-dihydroxy 2-butanone 4-phosphate synthase / GTP cyclohydrolase II
VSSLAALKMASMRLSEYLDLKGIRRTEFAQRIGVTSGWITQLCDGSGWPSRDVAERIAAETAGAVTADDFLRRENEARA